MNGRKLEKVEEEKDLGVIVDNELKFHKQSAAAVKKANMKLGMIKKVLRQLGRKHLAITLHIAGTITPGVRQHDMGSTLQGRRDCCGKGSTESNETGETDQSLTIQGKTAPP